MVFSAGLTVKLKMHRGPATWWITLSMAFVFIYIFYQSSSQYEKIASPHNFSGSMNFRVSKNAVNTLPKVNAPPDISRMYITVVITFAHVPTFLDVEWITYGYMKFQLAQGKFVRAPAHFWPICFL